MKSATVKPAHKPVKQYYQALEEFAAQGVSHEMAVRSAFQHLLEDTGRRFGWTLIAELSFEGRKGTVRPDGTFRDDFQMHRGYWEAKDTADDLEAEIRKKIARGYPLTNTIFEDTRRACLYQNGELAMRADLTQPRHLCDLLNAFFAYTEPAHDDFEKAIDEFQQRVPELARGLVVKIDEAHRENRPFQEAFEGFFDLCRESLNPNLSREAVDEMLVQHLLTERLIRTMFDRQDFVRRNVIACEVEKVIDALTVKEFSRDEFLKSLDRFYLAIEAAAATIGDFSEKQHFLNTIYERFFQGYSVKVADTMGIVYTPQEIVDFMCASVEEVLKTEFGKDLGSPGVNILDPCTGTGNFIVNLIRRVPKRHLRRVYREQLFANEVMLMPYYIAALNIEHAYYERSGDYEPFEGLCFVDTLDLAEDRDAVAVQKMIPGFHIEENIVRVERQANTPITVIIGNPPYNMQQQNENDNNKNRKYDVIAPRVSRTYGKASRASNVNKLIDPYVKFFRWATDRLGDREGIVCFVTNNSFVDQIAFDGMRKHLAADFQCIYHVDLHGNVRENPKLSGTTHNVFGIRVGVGITVAVRKGEPGNCSLRYHRVPESWRKEAKLGWLTEMVKISSVTWRDLHPDEKDTWLVAEHAEEFSAYVPVGTKMAKAAGADSVASVFSLYSLGVNTARDSVAYAFDPDTLMQQVVEFGDAYNSEVDRYQRTGKGANPDDFVRYDRLKWSETLKKNLLRGRYLEPDSACLRSSVYRPFCKRHLYFHEIVNERRYRFPLVFPTGASESENRIIWCKVGGDWPFFALVSNRIVNLLPQGGSQCFPYYAYDGDGSNRRENVTNWALKHFRKHYANKKITKWNIFYYVYGVLHHPGYRERFADNLKRELPRLPMAPDFRAFADAGRELARLHLEYEELEPYALEWVETPEVPLSYRVEKMRLSKDKTQLKVNDSLSLAGIPPEVFGYRLGNRSALDWVIDQYRIKPDKRSGITSDPNRGDDPEYIVRLVGQVVHVSMETVRIVGGLPEDFGAARGTADSAE